MDSLPAAPPSTTRTISPTLVLLLLLCCSVALYLVTLVMPYDLFTFVSQAPISLPEIARRDPLPAIAFLITFLALFALYALGIRVCRRDPNPRLAPLVIIGGLILAVVLSLIYPVGAGDVVDYVSHGEELAFYRQNPLVVPPAHIPGMAFTRYSAFRHVTSNYGPLWIWISGLVVGLMGRESLLLNLIGFKAVAITAYAAQAALIYTILRRRNASFALPGLLFFAWNPLILYEFAANGHNDATMMAFALAGILFWERRRPYLMVLALTCSFLIKIPTAPLLPLFLLAAARLRGSGRRFWATLVGGGALAAAVVGLAYLSLPNPLSALTNLSGRSNLFTHSLPTIVKLVLEYSGIAEHATAENVARTAALLALGIWYTIQIKRTWQHPSGAIQHAYHFVAFLLLLATPWFQPWYVTWMVALAALCPQSIAPTQAGLFSLSVMGSYVIYGFVWFWIVQVANWGLGLGINLMAVGTSFLIPWGYTVWSWLRARRRNRQSGGH